MVQSQEAISEEISDAVKSKRAEPGSTTMLKSNHQKNSSKIIDQFKEKQNILKNLLEDLELIQNESEKYKAENKKLKKIVRDLNNNLMANGQVPGEQIKSKNGERKERSLVVEDVGAASNRSEARLVKQLEREKTILADTITNQVTLIKNYNFLSNAS
jgi:hypothetical protein